MTVKQFEDVKIPVSSWYPAPRRRFAAHLAAVDGAVVLATGIDEFVRDFIEATALRPLEFSTKK